MRHETRVITAARDTAENWADEARPRGAGELALDTTNQKLKIGDGSAAFADLPAFATDALVNETAGTLRTETAAAIAALKDAGKRIKNGLPVGLLIPWPSNTAPPCCLPCTGGLVSRASYPDLWAFAQASGGLVGDAAWVDYMQTTATSLAQFTNGNGSTTFRLPYITDYLCGRASGVYPVGGWMHNRTVKGTTTMAMGNASNPGGVAVNYYIVAWYQ